MSKSKDTIILDGFGLSIRVEKGHLVCMDGCGRERRILKLSKIERIKRLMVLGHSGFFTLEALRWLHDRGCAVVCIDMDGQVIMAETAMKVDYPDIRRAQALAPHTPAGLAISKWLLRMKLEKQHELVADLPQGKLIQDCLTRMDDATTTDAVRDLEGEAAGYYWTAWGDLHVKWDKQVPGHWKSFSNRHSAICPNGNRKATDPLNACLNFAYGVLESEARIAIMALGMDTGLAFNHVDERGRENLVFDIMEPIRPVVDRFILGLVSEGLSAADFYEDRFGHVRCLEPITTRIAEEAAAWRALTGSVAEGVAQELDSLDISAYQPASLKKVQKVRPFPTPLSQKNQKRAQGKAA